MAKVLTVSRAFPSYHPKAGQPTYFIEKIWKSIGVDPNHVKDVADGLEKELYNAMTYQFESKNHTIREGKRFKTGDMASLRVWGNDVNPKSKRSGPYHSKQIIIAPDVRVKTWDIDMNWDSEVNEVDIRINGKWFCQVESIASEKIAKNDGLSIRDFVDWFMVTENKPFSGQIISWNENINY